MIDQILDFNRNFVASKAYEPFVTDKFPAKRLAVLTCMDTRLTELLPRALGLKNGDAKIIKNAGGLILSQTDSLFTKASAHSSPRKGHRNTLQNPWEGNGPAAMCWRTTAESQLSHPVPFQL